MSAEEENSRIPKGRLGRFTAIGALAGSLAGELATAATRYAVGKAKDEAARRFHENAAQKMLASLGRMKGLPMKVGQMLSYVDDFVPPEYREVYRDTLRTLQVHARPVRFEEIEAQIRADLGKAPSEIFAEFDRTPIAAASIGQVYRARLEDGTEVAVKVQYPGIAEAIKSDLDNVAVLKSALSVILPKVDVESSISDITARVLEECDYGCEINNQADFRSVWMGDPEIVVPKVFPELSGARVLVSEYIEGLRFDAMLAKATREEKSRYGHIIARFVFRSLYRHSMFNADPHPGNYLFTPDGRVAFLDFGCVQRYAPETVAAFKSVRDWVMRDDFAKDAAFRRLIREAYQIEVDLDEEEWAFMEDYVLLCFEPLVAAQPFKYGRAYTEKLADRTKAGVMLGARKALKKGIWEAKRPGLIFLNRINFGLNSILSMLEAEGDWRALVRIVDA